MSTLSLIFLIGTIVALWFLFKKKGSRSSGNKLLKPSSKNPNYAPEDLVLQNVEAGGVIKISALSTETGDIDLNILGRHVYRQGESSWYELECDKGGEKVWLGWEEDDELEISIQIATPKLRELNIDKGALEKMDDREKGDFEFEGEKFYYEDSDAAIFYRFGEDKSAEEFYYWEFENDAENKFISVEKWTDGSYDVSVTIPVKPAQISVYSISGTPASN